MYVGPNASATAALVDKHRAPHISAFVQSRQIYVQNNAKPLLQKQDNGS
jgi:hypothetical protein